MGTSSIQPANRTEELSRDAANWAPGISTLKMTPVPAEALNLNVEGRRLLGPLQGFGRMWEKTYRVTLRGAAVTPAEVVKTWKASFQKFAAPMLHFYLPPGGFLPGGVALINADVPGGMRVSTGAMVMYSDNESFSLITPQGHMFAGWITFSAFREESHTVAQVQVLIRASDPVYEIVMRLGGSVEEDKAWQTTLGALSAHYGVHEPVWTSIRCVDPKVRWSGAGNIVYNAAIHSILHLAVAPIRSARRLARR